MEHETRPSLEHAIVVEPQDAIHICTVGRYTTFLLISSVDPNHITMLTNRPVLLPIIYPAIAPNASGSG